MIYENITTILHVNLFYDIFPSKIVDATSHKQPQSIASSYK